MVCCSGKRGDELEHSSSSHPLAPKWTRKDFTEPGHSALMKGTPSPQRTFGNVLHESLESNAETQSNVSAEGYDGLQSTEVSRCVTPCSEELPDSIQPAGTFTQAEMTTGTSVSEEESQLRTVEEESKLQNHDRVAEFYASRKVSSERNRKSPSETPRRGVKFQDAGQESANGSEQSKKSEKLRSAPQGKARKTLGDWWGGGVPTPGSSLDMGAVKKGDFAPTSTDRTEYSKQDSLSDWFLDGKARPSSRTSETVFFNMQDECNNSPDSVD